MGNWLDYLALALVTSSLLAIPVGILVTIAVVAVVRWVLLWFFRVNQSLALLTESAATLRDIRDELRAQGAQPERDARVVEAPPVAFPSVQRAV